MAEDEITVTIDGATEQQSQPVPVQTEPTEPSQDLTEQFKALEAEKEAQRQRADRAEQETARQRQETARVEQEAKNYRSAAADSRLESIEAGINAAKTEASAAETEYATAFDNGDKSAMAAAQRKMARAEAKLLRFDEAKYELEAQRPQRTERTERQEPPQRQEQPREPADPVEAFIAQRSPKTAAWLRAHPDQTQALVHSMSGGGTAEQRRLAAKINAADSDALAEGYMRDSDEYFSHVETFIGIKKAPVTNGAANGANGNASAVNGKRRQSVPAAPVHQSGGGVGGNSGTEVRLSKKEADAAVDGTLVWNYDDPSGQKKFKKGDPIGVTEFARRKLEMQKQGLYDKSYTEQ